METGIKEMNIKDVVKEKYGEAARRAKTGEASCCAPTCCGNEKDPITGPRRRR